MLNYVRWFAAILDGRRVTKHNSKKGPPKKHIDKVLVQIDRVILEKKTSNSLWGFMLNTVIG